MSVVNLKFMHANLLRAAQLQLPINIMFSKDLVKAIEAWQPLLRMDSVATAIALFNIVGTTLEFSSVSRSVDDRCYVPLNFYNVVLARSSYGKSEITNLIRHVLHTIDAANGQTLDSCLDEFTRAGLMKCLDKCTKIFMNDEADMTFADAGLFNGYAKPSTENNCRSLVMTLHERIFFPYVRQLANRTVVVEKAKLNLLGLSTGEVMGTIVSRLKAGGSCDPMIGRFCWWALDGPPIMETLVEPVLNSCIPSVEQLTFVCNFIKNCRFKYEHEALVSIVEWGNSMRKKSYSCREDSTLSSILGKNIQHVHRFAAFMQTIEHGYHICSVYVDRFKEFPLNGSISEAFMDRTRSIFDETFNEYYDNDKKHHVFFICQEVVLRAIDLISVVYVSNQKLERIAIEILLYPSLCFTVTQLHSNSFLHNASSTNVRCVLDHLIKCDLIECVLKGIKTSRRSTSVYIKRLPLCEHDGEIDDEQKSIFDERLKEFTCYHRDFTINEYLKKNTTIALDAIGVVTEELIKYFSMAEYMKIDINPLYNLKETGDDKRIVSNKYIANGEEQMMNDLSQENNDCDRNRRVTTNSADMVTVDGEDHVSSIFDAVINEIGEREEQTNYLLDYEFQNDIDNIYIGQNVDIESDIFSNAHGQETEQVAFDHSASAGTSAIGFDTNEDVSLNKSKTKQNKIKNLNEQDSRRQPDDDSNLAFWSPPAFRLRSKKRFDHDNGSKTISSQKKNSGGKKK